MWKNLQETADLVTFTEEILNGQIHFITSASFKIDNVVLCEAKSERRQPDPNIFLQIAASAAVAAAVNPNGTKTLLDNGFSKFLIKSNPGFSNGPKRLPKNLSDCLILCNWDFDNFVLAELLFAKILRNFETYVTGTLCGKFFSSLEITFNKI